MDVILHLGLAAAGIAMLCVGADRLVAGAAALATRFGVSGFVIGVTVVAYGTSTPELAASLQAALHGETGIILGNVVGSNVANVGMVLGAAGVIGTIAVGRSVVRREVPIMLGASVLLLGVSADGTVGWLDGAVLLAALAAFTAYTLRKPRDGKSGGRSASTPRRSVAMVVLGAALLYIGAILTVDNSVLAAERFGVPPHIIGITVIAVGTSMPEMITTVTAVRRGRSDIGIANIIGSNILNVLFIVGVSSVVTDLMVGPGMWHHYAVMLAFAGALFLWWRGKQARWVGPALVGAYAAYLVMSVVPG